MKTPNADRPDPSSGPIVMPFSFLCILSMLFSIWMWNPPDPAFGSDGAASGRLVYGIACEQNDRIVKDVVKQNQNLSKILLAHNVSHSVIDAVARKSKPVFDVRKFRAGNPYCVISDSGAAAVARYFIYEQDPVNYVVYNLTEPDVYLGNKPISITLQEAAGSIDGSVPKTFSRLGLDYELAERLSAVYAWTLDFHHLQNGDQFRIIYEQQCVDGNRVGLGNILAARFTHADEDFYAFYYEKNGRGGYYDENGSSLEKAFLKAPLRYTRITSLPSSRRLHPILKVRKPHLGIDYAAPTGTPVYSVGDGIVTNSGYHRERGNYIVIRHSGLYKTEYYHLSRIEAAVKPGARVHRGKVIGYVGKTGRATGPHLEFRFWKNNRIFDYLNASLPSDTSLTPMEIPAFHAGIGALKTQLETMAPGTPERSPKQLARANF